MAFILLWENDPDLRDVVIDALHYLEVGVELVNDERGAIERLRNPPRPGLFIANARFEGKGDHSISRKIFREYSEIRCPVPILLLGGDRTNDFLNPSIWGSRNPLVRLSAPFSIDDFFWVVRRALGEI